MVFFQGEENRKGVAGMLPGLQKTGEPPAKSILISAERYVALDIETTGLDPALEQILELAAVRVENGEITERFSQLIRPTKPISPFITQLTGIDDRMVANAPSIEVVLPEFLAFLEDDLLLGHNTAFDLRFIRYHSMVVLKRKVCNPYTDTLRISRLLFPNLSNHKLSTLIQTFGVGDTVEHRALSDAVQTARCYEYMKRYAEENGIVLEETLAKKGRKRT